MVEEGETGLVGLEVWAKTVDMARQSSGKHDLRSKTIMANVNTLGSHNPSSSVRL